MVDATIAGGSQFTFTVNSIQNPGIYESPGRITIDMATQYGGAIDTGYYDMKANLYTPTFITRFEVVASDTMAGASDVVYYFKLIPK